MGLVKSDAQRKANQLQRKSAIAASDHAIINGPKPTTWSARMPAYVGTSLCVDPKLRGNIEMHEFVLVWVFLILYLTRDLFR